MNRPIELPWNDPPYIIIGIEIPYLVRQTILKLINECKHGIRQVEGHHRNLVLWAKENELCLGLVRIGMVHYVQRLGEIMGRIEGFCNVGHKNVIECNGPMVFCGKNGRVGKIGCVVDGNWMKGLGIRLGRILDKGVVNERFNIEIGWVQGRLKAEDRDRVAKGLVRVDRVRFDVQMNELAVMEVFDGGRIHVLSRHQFGEGFRNWNLFVNCLQSMVNQNVAEQKKLEMESQERERQEEEERRRREEQEEKERHRKEEKEREKLKRREGRSERKQQKELKKLEKHRKECPPSLYNLLTKTEG